MSTREALLDAVGHELQGRRWDAVTLAGVAGAAGVSRQTVYNAFGSREELAQAFVLREADRFLEGVEATVSGEDDPVAALRSAFDLFLAAAADDPLVRAIVAGDDELLPYVTTQAGPLLERAAGRLAQVMERWIDGADAALLAEAVVRLAISAASAPGLDGEAVARLLGPYIRR